MTWRALCLERPVRLSHPHHSSAVRGRFSWCTAPKFRPSESDTADPDTLNNTTRWFSSRASPRSWAVLKSVLSQIREQAFSFENLKLFEVSRRERSVGAVLGADFFEVLPQMRKDELSFRCWVDRILEISEDDAGVSSAATSLCGKEVGQDEKKENFTSYLLWFKLSISMVRNTPHVYGNVDKRSLGRVVITPPPPPPNNNINTAHRGWFQVNVNPIGDSK